MLRIIRVQGCFYHMNSTKMREAPFRGGYDVGMMIKKCGGASSSSEFYSTRLDLEEGLLKFQGHHRNM